MSQGYSKGIPIDTDSFLSANSDFLVPSQSAVFTFIARTGIVSIYGSSNAAFTQANAAFLVANAAYTNANALGISANAYSGAMANSVNAYTSATYSTLTQFGSVFDVANGAFGVANAAFGAANQAGVVANNANSYASSTYYLKTGGTISGDVAITGNLTISGNTSYVNTQTLLIGDSLITLNADLPNTVAATENAGLEVNRGSYGNSSIIWDETNDKWDLKVNTNVIMSMYAAGDVAIGPTPQTVYKSGGSSNSRSLTIAGDVGSSQAYGSISLIGSSGGNSIAGSLDFYGAGHSIGAAIRPVMVGAPAMDIGFYTYSGGTFAKRMTLASGGILYTGPQIVTNSIYGVETTAISLSNPATGVGSAPKINFTTASSDGGSREQSYIKSVKTIQGPGLTNVSAALVFGTAYAAEVSTERMRIDPNGFVGIGNTAPTSILHLQAASGPTINFQSTLKLMGFGLDSTGAFYLNDSTAGANRIYIANTGFVGIGNYYPATNLPKNALSVAGAASIGYGISADVTGPSNGLIVSGNVGIGTTSAAYKLDVAGSANISLPTLLVAGQNILASIASANAWANARSLVPVSGTSPTGNLSGQLWYNSNTGKLLIYYTDVDGSQWVDTYSGVASLTPANNWANVLFTVANTSIASGNNYAGAMANASNAWANTILNNKLANTNGAVFNGSLFFPNGNVSIGYATDQNFRLAVNGTFVANTKSFVIPHPTKQDMYLRHGSLEGPENGVYVRGKCNGNVITLPDYWIGLVDEDSITVTLTPYGYPQNLYVSSINGNKVYIGHEGGSAPMFFYMINAERKDVEKLVVEF